MSHISPLSKAGLAFFVESATGILACMVVYLGIYGAHLGLFVLATISFYYRIVGPGSKLPSIAMFTAILFSFATATIDTIAQIAMLVITVQMGLTPNNSDSPNPTQVPIDVAARLAASNSLSVWAMVAQPIINDSVVIWRAWVLFPRKRWMMFLPISLLFCTLGTSLTYFIRTTGTKGFVETQEDKQIGYYYGLAIIFSLSTNVIATSLIGYKLWSFSRFSQPLMRIGVSESKPATYRILIILVESGLSYCLFQVVFLIANFALYPVDRLRWPYLIFRSFAGSLSEVYPVLVVCLVHYRRTAADLKPHQMTSNTRYTSATYIDRDWSDPRGNQF